MRVQNEKFRAGQSIYLNVLQALNDWGTAVSSEAQQLLNYNVALAALEHTDRHDSGDTRSGVR